MNVDVQELSISPFPSRTLSILSHTYEILFHDHTAKSSWNQSSDVTVFDGIGGNFSTKSSPVHVTTGTHRIYRWLVRVPVGDKLQINWTYTSTDPIDQDTLTVRMNKHYHYSPFRFSLSYIPFRVYSDWTRQRQIDGDAIV